SRHETPPAMEPVRSDRHVRAPLQHVHGFVNRLLHHGERLRQHGHGCEFARHVHDVVIAVHHALGLVAIEPPDAALAVPARLAHVGASRVAAHALTAAAPHGEYGKVARLHARDRLSGFQHPAEHLVPDHEILLAVGRARTAAGDFLAVGAADADAYRLHLDVMG